METSLRCKFISLREDASQAIERWQGQIATTNEIFKNERLTWILNQTLEKLGSWITSEEYLAALEDIQHRNMCINRCESDQISSGGAAPNPGRIQACSTCEMNAP